MYEDTLAEFMYDDTLVELANLNQLAGKILTNEVACGLFVCYLLFYLI